MACGSRFDSFLSGFRVVGSYSISGVRTRCNLDGVSHSGPPCAQVLRVSWADPRSQEVLVLGFGVSWFAVGFGMSWSERWPSVLRTN